MAGQKSSSALAAPFHGAAAALRRVPGAGVVGRAAHETPDKAGAVSPRGRGSAVRTGAGVLGAAGGVERPVALTGAAAPRPEEGTGSGRRAAPPDTGTSGRTPRENASTGPLGPTARPGRTIL
ncbi:hypothetical protein [Streptomyces thermoalcalitolerans]|uniref:Uncharacterized protein n=1 Tax=Streptomyces thermoalcalitolerans TaxID=65605 RepID=A0ABP3ZC65_9ACTN